MTTSTNVLAWREQFQRDQKALTGSSDGGAYDGTYISTKGGLSIDGDPLPGNTLDCVIMGAVTEHDYYPEAYADGVTNVPSCFALGPLGAKGLAPHEASPDRQAGNCAECPHRQWVQDKNGRWLPLTCKTYVRLALLPSTCLKDPKKIAANTPYILRVPPVSAKKHFTPYREKVAKYGPLWSVVTRVSGNAFDLTFAGVDKAEQTDALMTALAARATELENWLLKPREQVEA